MNEGAKTVEDYLEKIPPDKKPALLKLRETILKNIPKGFEECIGYGMLAYVVPLSAYPEGYHCNPKLPLGFMNLAAQKNFIAVYHMGIYGNPKLLKWFTDEYSKVSKTKLDMGKACIRFKKPEQIPYELIGELVKKISVEDWIGFYEKAVKNR